MNVVGRGGNRQGVKCFGHIRDQTKGRAPREILIIAEIFLVPRKNYMALGEDFRARTSQTAPTLSGASNPLGRVKTPASAKAILILSAKLSPS